jgi:23S rRNA (cytidine1920-2'-O)/16S rRNA (cytidine1409-2'-O)-methyltransferase
MKLRLDNLLVSRGLVASRSQAESYIKLGKVSANGRIVNKPGAQIVDSAELKIDVDQQYVSRAALKLASVAEKLDLNFEGKVVLDVGSSTGGFTDYALKHGAKKVIAVDIGTNQLHPSLRDNPSIELHENTDIRQLEINTSVDVVLIDVSFISLREVLPQAAKLSQPGTQIVAMCKPQFEAGDKDKHKGVIKNDRLRRGILKEFEDWAKQYFVILDKADSEISGAKGNLERFYLLKLSNLAAR